LASVSLQVTVYSIGANFFPDHKEFMIGMLEAGAGLGMMVGPLIGTLLFSIGGYNFMYYSFGSIFYFLAVSMYFFLPKSLD
jgi:MFS family permease